MASTKLQRSNSLIKIPSFTSAPSKDSPYARLCKLVDAETTSTNKGSCVKWDEQKLKCSLSKNELSDELLLKNITQGYIVSGKLLPLVFDKALPDTPAYHRSLPFFQQVVEKPSLLATLTDTEMCYFVVGVRDFWLANLWGILNKEESTLLSSLLSVFDDEKCPYAELDSLSFSLAPTKSRRVLRYIERLEETVGEDFASIAAQIPVGKDILYAVWVDARDLSYHNFECILPLDRALQRSEDDGPMDIKMGNFKRLKNMNVFLGKLKGKDTGLLEQLDYLGLYQKPSNSDQRGGERFIFSSPALSKALTLALWDSGVLDLLPPKPQKEKKDKKGKKKNYWEKKKEEDKEEKERREKMKFDFVAVNSVFRCNRFAPGDSKFKVHMDTPYYDQTHGHISKYTIIIYVSGGTGTPALSIGGGEGEDGKEREKVEIKKLEDMQVVIFDQKYEHEGSAFVDSRKVFLRSELIFKEPKIKKEVQEIGGLFSSAIYFTSQSTFQPELAQHAHELYERVNRAHWGLQKNKYKNEPLFLHKNWDNKVHFATNGFDYYFPLFETDEKDEKEMLQLKTNALVAVLDYFNCKTREREEEEPKKKKKKTEKKEKKEEKKEKGGESCGVFRKLCETKVMKREEESGKERKGVSEWVVEYLWKQVPKSNDSSPLWNTVTLAEKHALVNANVPEEKSKEEKEREKEKRKEKRREREEAGEDVDDEDEDDDDDENGQCCAFHCFDDFRPTECDDVLEDFAKARKYTAKKLGEAPLAFLGKEVKIDPETILVQDGKIFINSANYTGEPIRVNFASCWNGVSPAAFIGLSDKISAPRLLLPPIPFRIVPTMEGQGAGLHLMLDFFKNDWTLPVVNLDQEVPIPKILELEEIEQDEDPPSAYLQAVNPDGDDVSCMPDAIHAVESENEEDESKNAGDESDE